MAITQKVIETRTVCCMSPSTSQLAITELYNEYNDVTVKLTFGTSLHHFTPIDICENCMLSNGQKCVPEASDLDLWPQKSNHLTKSGCFLRRFLRYDIHVYGLPWDDLDLWPPNIDTKNIQKAIKMTKLKTEKKVLWKETKMTTQTTMMGGGMNYRVWWGIWGLMTWKYLDNYVEHS